MAMKRLLLASCAILLPVAALAQVPEVGSIPNRMIGVPGGVPRIGTDGTISTQLVKPTGLPAPRTLADRGRDHVSIRDFLPAPACDGVTDDSLAVSYALAKMQGTGRNVEVTGDCRIKMGPAARLAGLTASIDETGLVGENGRDSGPAYGQKGSTILLTDTGGPAFIAKGAWRLERLVFDWPAQTEAAAIMNGGQPIVMPPLLSGAGSVSGGSPTVVSSGRFLDNDVINATTIIDVHNDVSGGFQVIGNLAYCLGPCFRLGNGQVENFFEHNHFTPFADQNDILSGPTYNLVNYGAINGAVISIEGTGTPTTVSTITTEAVQFDHNYVFGMGFGIHVTTGTLDLSESNSEYDGVPHVLAVDNGGAAIGFRAADPHVYSYTLTGGSNPIGPVQSWPYSIAASAAPGNSLHLDGIIMPNSTAGMVDVEKAGTLLTLTGVKSSGLNNNGGSFPGVKMNSPGGILQVTSSLLTTQGATPQSCIEVDAPLQMLSVVGNTMVTCREPMSITGNATDQAVTGNTSVASHSTGFAIIGSGATLLPNIGNHWDLPVAGWTIGEFRPSDGAMTFNFGGVAQFAISEAGALMPSGAVTAPDLNIGGTGSVLGQPAGVGLTVTSATGAYTTVSAASYVKKFGTSVHNDVVIYLTTVGTGTGTMTVSGFPIQSSTAACVLHGRDQSSGRSVNILIPCGSKRGELGLLRRNRPDRSSHVRVVWQLPDRQLSRRRRHPMRPFAPCSPGCWRLCRLPRWRSP